MRRVLAAVVCSALAAVSHPAPVSAAERPIGVLIADHGEPPEYNADTYWSFRAFVDHLMEMGVIPSWLRALETGTILQDPACYDCSEPMLGGARIDAWLDEHDGPAVFVPRSSDSLAAHYVMPGGPGLGEPDIFEHAGLQVWDEWRRMRGRSPNYDEKLPRKREVARRLRATYSDSVAVRVGYGIDPRINGGRQDLRRAVETLVRRDRIKALVVAYHGVGFSDIMQTHMIRHEINEALESLGSSIPVRFADPIGSSAHYVRAIVDKVRAELALLPSSAPVAVHLSGHGLPTAACGDYDCGADAYHTHSRRLFHRVKQAIVSSISRPGRFGVFHIYGDGGEGESDPEDVVDGPNEALSERRKQGFRYVVDIPYEFDANSRDTLIVLRAGYGREAPDWNDAYESHFRRDGMRVKIANASGGSAHKTAALEEMIRAKLDGWTGASAGAGHHH